MTAGAFQLLQLQEDMRRHYKTDSTAPENDVESHLRLNKDTLTNSLWKLNVVDIEVTLLHVCQMVRLFLGLFSYANLLSSKYVLLDASIFCSFLESETGNFTCKVLALV